MPVAGPASSSAPAAPIPAPVRRRFTPQTIARLLAGGLALGLVVFVLSGRNEPAPIVSPPADVPATAPEPAPLATAPVPPVAPLPAGPRPALDLQPLADLLVAQRDRQGQFPAEHPAARPLPADERLGWLAVLASASEPAGPQPQWDRPVLDPLNARFVRRRMPLFLNPLLADAAVEGLPATHFVGVAGVGADAARLPKSHPRAGIFGEGRETRIEDVRDGLSHTLLVLGAAGRPAPWSAGGERTIRPLTQEPYVGGADGFGTGQPDGMFVLLADGSTRFLSREVEPVILRRMAAMADGLPLDAAVSGEPGDPPRPAPLAESPPEPVAAPPATAITEPSPRPEPAVERVLPPPPSYNVEQALSQPLVRFSQSRAVPLRELLPLLQDLAGVPVEVDERAETALGKSVSLELSNTSVRDVLNSVARQVGLEVQTGTGFGVRLSSP